MDGDLVWNPEHFVLHFIGDLLKPNNEWKNQDNLAKCAIELTDITKNFSKTTLGYLQQVKYLQKSNFILSTLIFFNI